MSTIFSKVCKKLLNIVEHLCQSCISTYTRVKFRRFLKKECFSLTGYNFFTRFASNEVAFKFHDKFSTIWYCMYDICTRYQNGFKNSIIFLPPRTISFFCVRHNSILKLEIFMHIDTIICRLCPTSTNKFLLFVAYVLYYQKLQL
jgi:hypothetical protein